ncbi:MBL fold metallo-hydrolase [Candidatus Woesearchaeota archaeon]|nr:MBL fold metallo-hydrolase [Candidatus Woesearchaeota archaeon]
MFATKLLPWLWKTSHFSCCYLLNVNGKWVMVDTGHRPNQKAIAQEISSVVDPAQVSVVLLTHLHCDHIGNFDMFPNATFYASKEELAFFKNDAYGTILDEKLVGLFTIPVKTLPKTICGFDVLLTPGHTIGSVCFWDKSRKVLFSGDTYFREGCYGRTDLPSSVPAKMEQSIERVRALPFNLLCAGHEY